LATSTPSQVENTEPTNKVPTASARDPAANQGQLEPPMLDLGTTIGAIPSFTSTTQKQLDQVISWNGSPWEEDIFEDNKDMRVVKNAILTLNVSFKVKCFP
jgi:hypothetical protein